MEHLSKIQKQTLEIFQYGVENGTIQNSANSTSYDGRIIELNGKPTVNFFTNNYIGLEQDNRIKSAAIDFINRYGFHSSIPRTFVNFEHFELLENKLEQIFGNPVLLATTTTMGHFAYLPIIVNKDDIVILDQFVHTSVQMTAQYLKGCGIDVDIVKHNNIDKLEDKIINYSKSYKKVWYLCDGLYSMHGDGANMNGIEYLLNKYEQFHCYLDDAHGMSWIGKNGRGYALHHLEKHERLFIITSLNKAFGTFASAMIFPNKKYKELVKIIGSTTIFSTTTNHAAVGAALAAAEIHLSEEIYERQMILAEKIKLFRRKVEDLNIPVAFNNQSPIFLIGTGNKEMCASLTTELKNNSFIAGVSCYPSVPEKHSGLRFCVNYALKLSDIETALECVNVWMTKMEIRGEYSRDSMFKAYDYPRKALNELVPA